MKFKKAVAMLLAIMLSITSLSTMTTFAEQSSFGMLETVQSIPVQINNRLYATTSRLTKYTSAVEAANEAREKMLNHEPTITVYIKTTNSDPVKVFNQYNDELMKETSNGDEGDYMRWDINKTTPSYICTARKSAGTTYYYYDFHIEYLYLTTLEQKKQVDAKVQEIITGFNFTTETSDYDKVKTIYDYVCNNVKYADDISKDIVYTSWSALFNGEAVCQGYAQLIYKMLKEVGISNRVIPGYGYNEGIMHGWNIVKIGNCYYNLDATWDAQRSSEGLEYIYFLKGDDFKGHTRLEDYNTAEFYYQYPMAATDYGVGAPTLSENSAKSNFSMIKPEFKSVSRKKVKLRKVAGAKRYQIKYSLNKKFKKGTKTKIIKKTTYKFKKLKKKKYYVKFRAYKYIGGGKVYTQWSKIKKIKKK